MSEANQSVPAAYDAADADNNATCSPDRDAGGSAEPCPLKQKKVLDVAFQPLVASCSKTVTVLGSTQNYADGETVPIEVVAQAGGNPVRSFQGSVAANSYRHAWEIKDVLPTKTGAHFDELMELIGRADGQETPQSLILQFAPSAPKTSYASGNAHFDLTAEDYKLKLACEMKYVKGWGGEVVKLGAAAPPATGGEIAGFACGNGYRWMKQVGVGKNYWDGTAWQNLPAGFTLRDSNNFCVGFYKDGTDYKSQYGGTWPEAFTDWDIDDAAKQQKITAWANNVKTTWEGKFDVKNKDCKSGAKACCRYKIEVVASFAKQATFSSGNLIVADGNIRSNTGLFFIDEARIAMAAHEFGHFYGNPDEYAGADVDATLNDDGAVAGIDNDSIMGQDLTKVKKRHFRTICKHLESMISSQTGLTVTLEAVPV